MNGIQKFKWRCRLCGSENTQDSMKCTHCDSGHIRVSTLQTFIQNTSPRTVNHKFENTTNNVVNFAHMSLGDLPVMSKNCEQEMDNFCGINAGPNWTDMLLRTLTAICILIMFTILVFFIIVIGLAFIQTKASVSY